MNSQNSNSDEINLLELVSIFTNNWKQISLSTVFSALLFLGLSYTQPEIFRSKALLGINKLWSQQDSGPLGSFSGLASLAGVNISSSTMSKKDYGIAKLQSFDFFKYLDDKYNLSLDLLAAKKWSSSTNSFEYDENIVDFEVMKLSNFQKDKNNLQMEAHKKFLDALSISESNIEGLINISYDSLSSLYSKQILEILISEINASILEEDLTKANNSIEYLNKAYEDARIDTIKESITELLTKELSTKVIASTVDEYIFTILDSPDLNEKRLSPSRSSSILIGLLIGFAISFVYYFFTLMRIKNK